MHLKTYASLGIYPNSESGNEAVANCYFCGGDKFYINIEEGLYSCKTCGEGGNKYTFMNKVLNDCLGKGDIRELSEQRGIPSEALRWHGVVYNERINKWMIPVVEDRKLINIRLWSPVSGMTISLGACRTGLYNVDAIYTEDKVYICEGEWDAIAMDWLLCLENDTKSKVVGVPGASVFKDEWVEKFRGKDVVLCYDNDKAGKEGRLKAIRLLTNVAKSISYANWPEDTPLKYDIRDHLKNGGKLSQLNIVEHVQPKPLFQKKVGFYDVVNQFKERIFLTEDMINGLLLEMAVVFSNKLIGDPLWLFIIGPAGSGKTLMLNAVSGTNRTIFQSNLGPRTLISGFKTEDDSDPSLLPRLIGNTLVLKEYTEVMGLPSGDQEQIFATLRGAYDGRVERDYAHGVRRVYPDPNGPHKTCHFSILAGVTNAIHGDNRAALGERFLKYQMFPDDYDPVDQIRSAVNVATEQQASPEEVLRDIASAFIQEKLDRKMILPKTPKWVQEKIIGLSQVVSVIRANVSRRMGDLVYRPAPEVGTRLSKQLIKIGQCTSYVLDKKEVDEQIYRLILRVGLDTCYGWHRDVIMAVANNPDIILKDIIRQAVIGKGTAEKCLEDLYELRALDYDEKREGQLGHPPRTWKLTDSMQNLFTMAGLNEVKCEEIVSEVPKEARKQVPRPGKRVNRKFIAKGF